jgi:hypothetical protein
MRFPKSPVIAIDVAAESSAVIDIAIRLIRSNGAHAAAAFLEAYGFGFALIVRVLSEPSRRRREQRDLEHTWR